MQRTSFLPLGNQIQTEEEIKLNIKRQELSEYYGVPFGVFDSYDEDKQEIKDKAYAQALILEGKEIPDDLKERLLQYKKIADDKKLQRV
jgi:hypothetical protein